MRLPVPDASKQLDSKPAMKCRVRPNLADATECGINTDYVLQVANIKGVFTDDIPVCADHAGMAKRAARLLYGSGHIVQWLAVRVERYEAHVVEGELNRD